MWEHVCGSCWRYRIVDGGIKEDGFLDKVNLWENNWTFCQICAENDEICYIGFVK